MKALTAHIASTAEPLDWNLIAGGNERVLEFGESHGESAIRNEMILGMKAMQTQGVTHLGIEMLGDDHAALLKDYFRTGKRGDEILAALRKQWAWEPESYMAMIAAARKNGIEVVGLDISYAEFRANPNDPKNVRNPRMAKNIASVLRDPKARVAVLAGAIHVSKNAIDAHLPKGMTTKRFSFLSRRDFLEVAKDAKLKGKKLLPLPAEEQAKRGYHAYVFLPEILQKMESSGRPNTPTRGVSTTSPRTH